MNPQGGSGYEAGKRVFDVVSAAVGILLTAPLQLSVAIAVRARLGTPVLFRQERPGQGGQVFTMLKFRTMLPPSTDRLSDADRLTLFGEFLRSTSLDELPALWNVLRGDMSLVGPRPLLVEYLPLYSREQSRRHQVRPGITGLAQVSGRNAISWEDRLALDVEYVDRRCWRLDGWILIRTLSKVIGREGVSAEGEATMSRFTGSRSMGTP